METIHKKAQEPEDNPYVWELDEATSYQEAGVSKCALTAGVCHQLARFGQAIHGEPPDGGEAWPTNHDTGPLPLETCNFPIAKTAKAEREVVAQIQQRISEEAKKLEAAVRKQKRQAAQRSQQRGNVKGS